MSQDAIGRAIDTRFAADDEDLVPDLADLDLRPALEAVLMVVDEPATEEHLAKVLQRPVRQVAGALRALADEYTVQGRGFELRLVAGGWRFYSRATYAAAVESFVLDGQQARLTQAALERESGAILYRTTHYFLERMGLRGLDELPELAPFLPEAEAIEAETLEGVPSFDPDAEDDGAAHGHGYTGAVEDDHLDHLDPTEH
ncbi:SMC-Scp complex subunit ScpB [Streptomyces sp. NEAU-H3]|uniref:SMC-Scp complex subunit ScpB n=1 Tax=Streptomyces sp. NEAU-H3 TaxID=2720636 RepID=UPI00143AA74D|nr:SMC-Scp complex subunit ScpB [Streptomyces sp. NEAU-H3]NJA59322.1 SMC-Scp complex subunit ScpB [Streptomyces sp. NEAU-H3]